MNQVNLGGMKAKAAASRAKMAGVLPGEYRGKLLTLSFDATRAGATQVISEWLVLAAYQDNAKDTVGKKVHIKFLLEGRGSEIGVEKFASHLSEIVKETGHDLDNYQTPADYTQLFLELQAYTTIKTLVGKANKDPEKAAYPNWYIKKDRPQAVTAPVVTAPAPVVAPAPVAAPVAAPVSQPAPTPAPAPAPAPVAEAPAPAPVSKVNKLFDE